MVPLRICFKGDAKGQPQPRECYGGYMGRKDEIDRQTEGMCLCGCVW